MALGGLVPEAEEQWVAGVTVDGPRRGRVRRATGVLFVVTAFAFLGLMVARNVGQLSAHDWSIRPLLLLASLAVLVIGLGWGIVVWHLLLLRMGYRVRPWALARLWFVSGLGRYIPGKIWQFVGAARMGSDVGMPPVVTVTSLAVHGFLFAVAAAVLSVYLVPAGDWISPSVHEILRWTAPLMLLSLHPAVARRVLGLISRTTRTELVEWTGSWGSATALMALSIIAWLLTGTALYLFVLSLTPLPLSAVAPIIGFNALAFIIGYAVFIAPAGLGAKEGVLAVLLSMFMPPAVAGVVAIAARLWSLVGEVVPALVLLRTPGGDEEAPIAFEPGADP